MWNLILMLFVVIVVPPFVSSKRSKVNKKSNKIKTTLVIILGIFIVVIVNLQYLSLLNFWNYNYEFEDNQTSYFVTFPRTPETVEKENRIQLSYHDDYRSIELDHVKSKVDFDINTATDIYTKKMKLALISQEIEDNIYTLRFNRLDEKDRFIVIYKKIYLFDQSYLELTYSYLKSSEKIIKDIDRYLDIVPLSK